MFYIIRFASVRKCLSHFRILICFIYNFKLNLSVHKWCINVLVLFPNYIIHRFVFPLKAILRLRCSDWSLANEWRRVNKWRHHVSLCRMRQLVPHETFLMIGLQSASENLDAVWSHHIFINIDDAILTVPYNARWKRGNEILLCNKITLSILNSCSPSKCSVVIFTESINWSCI